MSSLKTPVSSGKRRRASNKSGRRFTVKKESGNKNNLPSPAAFPRKAKKVQNAFRLMATGAIFFILLSTITSWRSRVAKRRMQNGGRGAAELGRQSSFRSLFSFRLGRRAVKSGNANSFVEKSVLESHETVPGIANQIEQEPNGSVALDSRSESAAVGVSSDEDPKDPTENAPASKSEAGQVDEEPVSFEELPERIEWYSREDYKDGSRPMCRISSPYILSNGTILVPAWMENHDKLLQRCGLGTHSFYHSSTGPVGLERTRDISSDFALTIHPERFQEPTHIASVYLTEHILKSSYLFDVFGGDAKPVNGVKEHHCYTSENDSTCALPRPVPALLKPAIFVPKRIETAPTAMWSRQLIDMFGKAHGHGHEATHLNASTMLIKSHQGQSEHLIGTSFRSILTTDGMFRHLPPNALQHSNFYSLKNGIDKSPKQQVAGEECKVSIGIADSGEGEGKGGIQGAENLREKIEVLSKLAVPGSSIETRLISISPTVSLPDHIKEMQELDIYLGGSGNEMSSIGFLRSSSSAFELMPFGIKPNTHESLARALGLEYTSIRGKPQVDFFKRCIDGEIFNLRKKGTLSFTESPEWQEPVAKAWDDAVSDFVLSGSSSLDILTAEPPINNYHARVCAQKQNIEIAIDETARKIILLAKEKCSGS